METRACTRLFTEQSPLSTHLTLCLTSQYLQVLQSNILQMTCKGDDGHNSSPCRVKINISCRFDTPQKGGKNWKDFYRSARTEYKINLISLLWVSPEYAETTHYCFLCLNINICFSCENVSAKRLRGLDYSPPGCCGSFPCSNNEAH